jgi:hypothetical protein
MIDLNLLNRIFNSDLERREISFISQETPVPYKPVITQNDARNGYVMRYFVKLANTNSLVTEVNKIQFQTLKNNPRFSTVEIRWKILGKKETTKTDSGIVNEGIADINKNEVLKADLTVRGVRSYIIDYTEFWVGESL